MQHVFIDDLEAFSLAEEVFKSQNPVVLLRMPAVFVLLAPPTRAGIETLHQTKNRLGGKNYGTAIGHVEQFFALAQRDFLPQFIREANDLNIFNGAFIRMQITDTSFNSDLVRNGTHQGVLIPEGKYRSLFMALENCMLDKTEPELFDGLSFASPLCTSANISGDVLGSITELDRALDFGNLRNIPLFINSDYVDDEKGSYPIFSLAPTRVKIERNGPGEAEILNKIPVAYRHGSY